MLKKNIISVTIAILIAYLSLSDSDKIPHIQAFSFRGFDKIVHLIMYFVLMSAMIFENRSRISPSGKLFIMGLIPLAFGLVLELLQSWLTTSRVGSFYDLLADSAGILLASFLYLFLQRSALFRIKK